MRDGIYIVDGDGHVMDFPHRCYQKYLPEQYRRRIAFFPGAQWDRRQAPNGDLGRDPNTPHEMMADMAQEGIDLAFLYPTSALRIGEIREVDYQTALCRAYNDFIADWCKADPQRLKGVAIVPYLDPTEAARELDRAVSRLGLVGLMFPTFIPGRNVADPFFWPIYEEAERLGVPVGMHASGSETGDPYRFNNFLGVHTWTHAPEQMISVISCVYGGLFEKFQRLRIGFMESGAGWVPFFMEHMDGEFEKRPWDAPLCRAKPSEYMTCAQRVHDVRGQHPLRVGVSSLGQRVAAHGRRAHEARRPKCACEDENPGAERAPVLRSESAVVEIGGSHDASSRHRGRNGLSRANARRPHVRPLGAGEPDDAPPRAEGDSVHVEGVCA